VRTVDIPGGKATLYDANEIPNRLRVLVEDATLAAAGVAKRLQEMEDLEVPEGEDSISAGLAQAAKLGLSRQEANALRELREAIAVACLKSWTLPQPLPTMDTVRDLPADLYEAVLQVASTSEPVAETDFSPAPSSEKDRPTGASGLSNGLSTAAPMPSIPTPGGFGANTATGSSIPA